MIISVEGNIGAGKTTLLSELQNYTDFTVYQENVNNWTQLTNYYRDPKTYAFQLQEEILLDLKNNRPLVQNIITERCAQTSIEVLMTNNALICLLYVLGCNFYSSPRKKS